MLFTESSVDNRMRELSTQGRLTVTNTTVQIRATQWDDSGSYECRANNRLGNAEAKGILTVYSEYTRANDSVDVHVCAFTCYIHASLLRYKLYVIVEISC